MLISMLKSILLTLLTACGGSSTPEGPNERQPPETEDPTADQHFCCKSIDIKTKTGQDCVSLSKDNIDDCNAVLYCSGFWGKQDGVVTCE